MVACIAMRGNAVVTPPTGWAAAATQQNSGDTDNTDGIASAAMFYIVRESSAPALTCTRTGGDVAYAKVLSYSGVSKNNPYHTGVAATQGSAGNNPNTGSGITTTLAGELIVAFVAYGDQYTVSDFEAPTIPWTGSGATDTTNAPSNNQWRERFDANTNTGADTGIGIADGVMTNAGGATGTMNATVSSANGRNVMMAAAFFPEVSPTVVLNSPADAGSTSDTTPTLDFTGTDANGDSIEYQVQVDTVNTFDSVSVGFDLKYVLLKLRKQGSPTDNLTVEIRSSLGGSSLGTSNTVAGSSLSTTAGMILFTWTTPVTLSPSTQYFLVLTRSGARDGTNWYQWEYGWDGEDTNTQEYVLSSGTWNGSGSADAIFTIRDSSSVDRIVQSDTDNLFRGLLGGTGGGGSGENNQQLGQSFTVSITGPLINAVSETDAGFVNPDTGGDTHPFNSGENIQYTVQSALSNGTYYWRVRGKDPAGSNTYGAYATTQSFTISGGYTLSAGAGGFTYAGGDTGLLRGLKLPADAGAYAYTGGDANLFRGCVTVAETGAYTYTGNDATLIALRKLIADTGAYSYSANDANLLWGHRLGVGAGDYLYAGGDATFSRAVTIITEGGVYSYSAGDVNLLFSRVLVAESGSYTYAGGDANLARGFVIVTEGGSYVYTGNDANLLFGHLLAALAGEYNYTGSDVSLIHESGATLIAEAGGFTYVGGDASFSIGKSISAETGAFNYLGSDAGLRRTWQLVAETGGYNLAAGDAGLLRGLKLLADLGVFTYTANDATFLRGLRLIADVGAYNYAGGDVELAKSGGLTASVGVFGYTGNDANLLYNRLISLDVGAFNYLGNDANLLFNRYLSAGAGDYNYSGQDAALRWNHILVTESGSYLYIGNDANLLFGRRLAADAGGFNYLGSDANLLWNHRLEAENGGYLYTGGDAEFRKTIALLAETGAYSYTGNDVGLLKALMLLAETGVFTYEGHSADLIRLRLFKLPFTLSLSTGRQSMVIGSGSQDLAINTGHQILRID